MIRRTDCSNYKNRQTINIRFCIHNKIVSILCWWNSWPKVSIKCPFKGTVRQFCNKDAAKSERESIIQPNSWLMPYKQAPWKALEIAAIQCTPTNDAAGQVSGIIRSKTTRRQLCSHLARNHFAWRLARFCSKYLQFWWKHLNLLSRAMKKHFNKALTATGMLPLMVCLEIPTMHGRCDLAWRLLN